MTEIVKEINDEIFATDRSQVSFFWDEKTRKTDLTPWWKWGLGQDGEIYIKGQISGYCFTTNWILLSLSTVRLSSREIRLIATKLLNCVELSPPFGNPPQAKLIEYVPPKTHATGYISGHEND